MKLIAIGDIHGRGEWRQIIEHEKPDMAIFIGDYFDSREKISPTVQLDNFRALCDLRRSNPDSVKLLLGNHDYHYSGYTERRYSGYNYEYADMIHFAMKKALSEELIQLAYLYNQYLFTHAGLTKTWSLNAAMSSFHPRIKRVDQFLNNILTYKPSLLDFTSGPRWDQFGDEPCQTPIWVRPNSLKEDCTYFIHVVGHTEMESVQANIISDRYGAIFIDTLRTSGQYMVLHNNHLTFPTYKSYGKD